MYIKLLFENTKLKIAIARILYRVVKLFYKEDIQTIRRNGINYEIDLSEGMELSLFLFGGFQNHILNNKYLKVQRDFVILDIGANVGIMTLQYAQKIPDGRIYAFEPTHYSFKKLSKNVSLNPFLGSRITILNAFVSESSSNTPEIVAFSSWKVNGQRNPLDHPIHLGTPKSTENVLSLSLDNFITDYKLNKLDLIKIDADGHEYEIFLGAEKAIELFRPIILFEIAIYVMEEKNINFDFYFNYFSSKGYTLFDTKSNRLLNLENYLKYIPKMGGTDLIAIPN